MFNFSFKKHIRVKIQENNIFIDNQSRTIGTAVELSPIFKFKEQVPEIKVYENGDLIRLYKIETLNTNTDLTGQFLHSSIIIQPNSGVMIDGIISKSSEVCPKWIDDDCEAIRLQPFYLSNANNYNDGLIGKGLFERGLHYAGRITPTTVRNICICDYCRKSFTIQHFHAGVSESQYFYSPKSKETLIVPYNLFENIPTQLQKDIDLVKLESMEHKLLKPINDVGTFKYYNSFCCPHCFSPYIDFEKNKEIRSVEYYGNFYINQEPRRMDLINRGDSPTSNTHT